MYLVLEGAHEIRRIQLCRIVLLSPERLAKQNRIHSGEVGHGAGVEVLADEDGGGVVVGTEGCQPEAGSLFSHDIGASLVDVLPTGGFVGIGAAHQVSIRIVSILLQYFDVILTLVGIFALHQTTLSVKIERGPGEGLTQSKLINAQLVQNVSRSNHQCLVREMRVEHGGEEVRGAVLGSSARPQERLVIVRTELGEQLWPDVVLPVGAADGHEQ